MLTLPRLVERAAQTYVAVNQEVSIPFDAVIDPLMGEVASWLEGHGVKEFGPAIFKYNRVVMPELGMEFGFVAADPPEGDKRIVRGTLPAGTYVTVTYVGPYDDLESATAVVIGRAREKGIVWDSEETPNGEIFAARFELYRSGPKDEPDPQKWETQIFIKTRE